ncbi:MAG: sodium-dependent dicarboxylate transporter 2/3/5 [Reinekea sp.]|jgi:sodium-dependent dicarboxylate transporter 2/3/5|uniref:SLC13 family permease n=3 Tax=Reinekea sp. TaxID=1970455 RepID=UPI003988BA99
MLTRFKQIRPKIWAALTFISILIAPYFGLAETLSINAAQEKTILILVLAAVLWVTEWLPLFVVSFVILALELTWLFPSLTQLGINVSEEIFFAPFFSNIILLFLGGFVLSSIMQKASLDARFAHFILRVTKGQPAHTLLGIIIGGAFLSMWMSNTATTAMMLTLVLPLVKRLRPDAPFRMALILAIPMACNLGGIGTPIGTPPNAIAMSYLAGKGIQISFLEWMILTIPFLIIALGVLWFALLKLYPPDDEQLSFDVQDSEPYSTRQWLTVAIFAITVVGWLIGGQFGLETGTVALFPIIASFWLGLLDQNDFRGLPWDVLFMVAGGIALGVAMDATALGDVIITVLPLDGSFLSLLIPLLIVAMVLGGVMSNTATAGLMIPLIISLSLPATQLTVLVLAITLNCSTAMILPVSTPPNAIAFSSGVLAVKDLIRIGFLMALIGLVIGLSVGPLYWFMIL